MKSIHINYRGHDIEIFIKGGFIMLNATSVAGIFGKEVWGYINESNETKFISEVESIKKIPHNKLVLIINSKRGVTNIWLQSNIALRFARWVDLGFFVWFYEQIESFLLISYTPKDIPNQKRLAQMIIDSTTNAGHCTSVNRLSNKLLDIGIDIQENELFKWFRDNKYLVGYKSDNWNMPTQKAKELGLFELHEEVYIAKTKEIFTRTVPKITNKGIKYFLEIFLAKRGEFPIKQHRRYRLGQCCSYEGA